MTQDTRKDQRAKIVSLNVRYKSATVDEFIENHSHDVSKGGIFIKTPTPFAPGTLLKLELRISGDDKAVIVGVGRAVWKREPARASADAPAGMGVKFIKIDEASRRLIDRVVAEKVGAGSAYRSEREDTGRPISDAPARVMPSARPSAPPSSGSGGGGYERKATMMGINSPLPPTPRGGYGPAGSGPSMFPRARGDSSSPLAGERTVMKQAAELLEEALKEAGGSLAEVGHHPSFYPGSTPPSSSARGRGNELVEKQTLIGMPSARPSLLPEADEPSRSANAHTRKTAPPPAGIPTPRSLARAAISIPPDALVDDRDSRDDARNSSPNVTQRMVSASLGTGMGSAGGLLAEPALPGPPRTPSMTVPLSKKSPPPVPPAPAPKLLAKASGRLSVLSMPPTGKRVNPVIWLALGVVGLAAVAFASRDVFRSPPGASTKAKVVASAEADNGEGEGAEAPVAAPSATAVAAASVDAGPRQASVDAGAAAKTPPPIVTAAPAPRQPVLTPAAPTSPPRAAVVASPRPTPTVATTAQVPSTEAPSDATAHPAATVPTITASPTPTAPAGPTAAPTPAAGGSSDPSDNPY